jgi:hypothetical protein
MSRSDSGSDNGRKKKAVVAGVLIAALLGGTAAYALWSASGSGSGSAKAITAQTITVTAATGTADLWPGGPAGRVYFTLTNPNPYQVTMTAMTSGTVSGGAPGCATTNVTAGNAGSLSFIVPGGTTTGTLSIPGVVSMDANAPDQCQGATFTIPLTFTGSQS